MKSLLAGLKRSSFQLERVEARISSAFFGLLLAGFGRVTCRVSPRRATYFLFVAPKREVGKEKGARHLGVTLRLQARIEPAPAVRLRQSALFRRTSLQATDITVAGAARPACTR
jgi:hypothetical protein